MEKRMVWNPTHRECVYWDESWSAEEFRSLIAAAEAEAPDGAEVRVSVELERGCRDDESGTAILEIGFNRPETEEEARVREGEDRLRIERQRQHELMTLASLQAKYSQQK